MGGIGSDIAIKAFDKTYRLHRLILTQSSLFESMFQGPWKERSQDVVEMRFDDPNITQEGFEIAIARLYGVWTEEDDYGRKKGKVTAGEDTSSDSQDSTVEDYTIITFMSTKNVLSVLATGAYLGMDSLCEQCTVFICRTLSTHFISKFIQFTHNNSYHPWSDTISNACHTYLCRNGFNDPRMKCRQVFERLPAPWLLSVLGSDAFWVPNEWERYRLCRQIVHNRRKIDMDSDDEAVYETLFSTKINYMHMTFEQMQLILCDVDPVTGYSFAPPEVIHEALWQQVELRALIEQSAKEDNVLDITAELPSTWKQQGKDYDLVPSQDRIITGDSHIAKDSSAPVPVGQRHALHAPFRFSVEFSNVLALQEESRVESDTVFYAGSYWSLRIEKKSTPEGPEGMMRVSVFLHRHSPPQLSHPSKRSRRSLRAPTATMRRSLGPGRPGTDQDQQPGPSDVRNRTTSADDQEPQSKDVDLPDLDVTNVVPVKESSSGYIDARTSIKTWFKIFVTSLGPTHSIRQYQCAPHDFLAKGTWGWRYSIPCPGSYIPDDGEPKDDLETRFDTACNLHSCGELDMEPIVDDLIIISLPPSRGKQKKSNTGSHDTGAGARNDEREEVNDEDGEEQENGDSSNNEKDRKDSIDTGVDTDCTCEAQAQYGQHHHHDPRPATLKFSVVVGHY